MDNYIKQVEDRQRKLCLIASEMSLQESLNRFQRQQEKCQTTLIRITTRAAPPKVVQSHKSTPASNSSAPLKVTASVKFSNDTERLQHINAIRKSPVGAQLKRVIDLLYETRQTLTPEEINEACYVDINSNKALFDSLKNNTKVHYDGKRFSYKSKYDLKGKDQLLSLIRKYPEGLQVVEVKDSYPSVMEDLQALKAAGQIWLMSNMDSQEHIVYPNDPKVMIKVDDDLKQHFREIELPRDMVDIEKDLQKNGMKPATNTAKRRVLALFHGITSKPKPKKKRQITKRTKLTNAHLPELFQS
ncbi:unnamed protein product [Musa textilis]